MNILNLFKRKNNNDKVIIKGIGPCKFIGNNYKEPQVCDICIKRNNYYQEEYYMYNNDNTWKYIGVDPITIIVDDILNIDDNTRETLLSLGLSITTDLDYNSIKLIFSNKYIMNTSHYYINNKKRYNRNNQYSITNDRALCLYYNNKNCYISIIINYQKMKDIVYIENGTKDITMIMVK